LRSFLALRHALVNVTLKASHFVKRSVTDVACNIAEMLVQQSYEINVAADAGKMNN